MLLNHTKYSFDYLLQAMDQNRCHHKLSKACKAPINTPRDGFSTRAEMANLYNWVPAQTLFVLFLRS